MADVVLIGAGGHARVVADAMALSGMTLAGHVALKADVSGRLGPYLGRDTGDGKYVMGMGYVDAASARRRAGLLPMTMVTVVHPGAIVAASAVLADGCFVAAGAVVAVDVRLGRACIVNTGAVVDHDCVLGENSHVATGARVAGEVTIGRDVLIGTGAVVRQGIRIGDGAIVGAGAVVVRDVAAGVVVVGNPARVLG